MSKFGIPVLKTKKSTGQIPVARKQRSSKEMSRSQKTSSKSVLDGSSGSDSAYWSLKEDNHQFSKVKLSFKTEGKV